jgi:hypothetical protein
MIRCRIKYLCYSDAVCRPGDDQLQNCYTTSNSARPHYAHKRTKTSRDQRESHGFNEKRPTPHGFKEKGPTPHGFKEKGPPHWDTWYSTTASRPNKPDFSHLPLSKVQPTPPPDTQEAPTSRLESSVPSQGTHTVWMHAAARAFGQKMDAEDEG